MAAENPGLREPGEEMSAEAARRFAEENGLDLFPHPDRVSDAYAEERIREKIGFASNEREKAGLRNVDESLKRAGVPPALRLHHITAVYHLGRHARESLPERVARVPARYEAGPRPLNE